MRRTALRLRLPLLLACGVASSGCAITLRHGPLDAPAVVQTGAVAHQKVARGPQGSVGWGRGTLFGIPFVPIFIQGDQSHGGERLMVEVRDALVAAGYDTEVVEPGESPQLPVLECRFEARFNNYTWIFPIVPTWGSMQLSADLVDPSRQILWSGEFEGDGFTLNFFNGYNSAAKQSLTEILNQMVHALAGEEFHAALTSAAPENLVEAEEPTAASP